MIRVRSREEPESEHLQAVRGGHAVQFLIDGADQNLPPEAFDGALGLALLAKPIEHRNAIQVVAEALAIDGEKGAAHGELLTEIQKREFQKRFGEVRGRRQGTGFKRAGAAAWLHEREFAMERNALLHAQTAVEIQQIVTAMQQDVLAVVDTLGFAARPDFVGSRPAAGERARLEERDGVPRAAECRRSGESGQTSADYDYFSHGKGIPRVRRVRTLSMAFEWASVPVKVTSGILRRPSRAGRDQTSPWRRPKLPGKNCYT